jgi:hypothetical protein
VLQMAVEDANNRLMRVRALMFSELHVEQIRECGRREFPILHL